MDWGIHLPHLGRQATRRNLIDFAQHADELGFHSGWVSDHVAWPRDDRVEVPVHRRRVVRAADGHAVARPDRHDVLRRRLHRAAAARRHRADPRLPTAGADGQGDRLARRRLRRPGHPRRRRRLDARGVRGARHALRPSRQAGRRAARAVPRRCSPRPTRATTASTTTCPEIGFEPKPVNGTVPIWVGGDSEAAFRRTVRFGDALHAAFQPLDVVDAGWRRVGELCAEAGRAPGDVRLSVRLYLDPEGSMPAAKSIAGSPEQMLDTIGAVGGDRRRPHPARPRGPRRDRRSPGGDGAPDGRRRAASPDLAPRRLVARSCRRRPRPRPNARPDRPRSLRTGPKRSLKTSARRARLGLRRSGGSARASPTLWPCRSRCWGRARGGRRSRGWWRRGTRRVIWARSSDTAAEIDGGHTNESYLPGFTLPENLMATDDLEKAMRHAELLIVGVPTTAMRSTMALAKEWIHPWIPIVSLAKGLEQGSLLRMTEVIADEVPGPPRRHAHRAEHRPRDHGRAGRGERDRHRGPGRRPGHPDRADARAVPHLHEPRRHRVRARRRPQERRGDRLRHRPGPRRRRQHAGHGDDPRAWPS